jgi:hypothetical protein
LAVYGGGGGMARETEIKNEKFFAGRVAEEKKIW